MKPSLVHPNVIQSTLQLARPHVNNILVCQAAEDVESRLAQEPCTDMPDQGSGRVKVFTTLVSETVSGKAPAKRAVREEEGIGQRLPKAAYCSDALIPSIMPRDDELSRSRLPFSRVVIEHDGGYFCDTRILNRDTGMRELLWGEGGKESKTLGKRVDIEQSLTNSVRPGSRKGSDPIAKGCVLPKITIVEQPTNTGVGVVWANAMVEVALNCKEPLRAGERRELSGGLKGGEGIEEIKDTRSGRYVLGVDEYVELGREGGKRRNVVGMGAIRTAAEASVFIGQKTNSAAWALTLVPHQSL